MMVELIEDFFAENPATSGEPDAIDTDEVIIALAKTVADLTCSQNNYSSQRTALHLWRSLPRSQGARARFSGGFGILKL